MDSLAQTILTDTTTLSADYLTTELSATLETTLSALEEQVPQLRNLQKELEEQINFTPILTAIQTATNILSSIPTDPYQVLLSEYFEPDHKFKTIDDIPDPGPLPLVECLNYLKEKDAQTQKIMFHNLTACEEQKFTSVFCYLSNDAVFVDHEKQKNYLEFFEMLRNIPLNSINEENCDIIANKLIAEYIKVV